MSKNELVWFPKDELEVRVGADGQYQLWGYPVLLTIAEYNAILKRGKRLCLHDWKYRKEREPGGLRIIISRDEIVESNIPAGRYCTKCGRIEWCKPKDDSTPWEQLDFTPKR